MTIVVGYHRTDPGTAALERAVEEAQKESDALIVVGYVPLSTTEAGALEYQDRVRAKEVEISAFLDTQAQDGLRGVVEVPKGVDAPAEAILTAAAKHSADLIVVGMRNRSRVGKLVLGSAAQSILLGSSCDVLAVKHRTES